MRIFKCTMENLDNVAEFYDKVTGYLEKNVNYPKWTHKEYPARESVVQAIGDGSQYACEDNGRIIGAFVLNDDPREIIAPEIGKSRLIGESFWLYMRLQEIRKYVRAD